VRCGTATTIQTLAPGVPSYGNLVDTVYSVIEQYRSNGARWVMSDSFEGTIRQITDTQGRPLWQPTVAAGEPDMLLGYRVVDDRWLGSRHRGGYRRGFRRLLGIRDPR
jgi:HK97 family phage major capsid protein